MISMDKKHLLIIRKYFPLAIIIALSLFLRLVWLDRVPTGITDDVLDFATDAKAIFYTGRDVTGQSSPLNLSSPPMDYHKPELASLVMVPFIGPVKLNLFTVRLPSVLLGTMMIAVIYLIFFKLFNPLFAFIVGLVAAFNPELIILHRTGYEAPLSCALYFIGLYIILFSAGWKILLSFPFLFLGFYSYGGTKINFLPFVIISCIYAWHSISKKKFTRNYLLLILLSFLLFGYFIYSLRYREATRLGELISPMNPEIVRVVNEERRLSIDNPLVPIFSNKLAVVARVFIEKYLGIFSANFLFLNGEGQQYFSLWHHGMFYYLDFIFLLLGFVYIFSRRKKMWLFLVSLALISPIPSAVNMIGTEYAVRSILIYPPLIVFVAAGIYFIVEIIKGKRAFKYLLIFLGLIYLAQFFNFAQLYFLRNPIYNSEGSSFSYRVLSNYINLARSDHKEVLVLVKSPISQFKMYLFYSGNLEKEGVGLVRSQWGAEEYHLENIRFTSRCNEGFVVPRDSVVIVAQGFNCEIMEKEKSWLSISQLSDGGEIYRIFNDSTCYPFDLNSYPRDIKFSDFRVENLPLKDFCQKFVSNLTGYSKK